MLAYGKLSTDLMAYGQGVKSALGLEFSGQLGAAPGSAPCFGRMLMLGFASHACTQQLPSLKRRWHWAQQIPRAPSKTC